MTVIIDEKSSVKCSVRKGHLNALDSELISTYFPLSKPPIASLNVAMASRTIFIGQIA